MRGSLAETSRRRCNAAGSVVLSSARIHSKFWSDWPSTVEAVERRSGPQFRQGVTTETWGSHSPAPPGR